MARTQANDPSQETTVPQSFAEVPPSPYSRVTGEAWIVEGMMQMQNTLGELKAHLEQTRSAVGTHEHAFRTDFRWTWGGLAAAVIILMGALIGGYFRLDDRQSNLSTALTRIETKVDSLLQKPSPPPASVIPGTR
jgi:hypothetical protein